MNSCAYLYGLCQLVLGLSNTMYSPIKHQYSMSICVESNTGKYNGECKTSKRYGEALNIRNFQQSQFSQLHIKEVKMLTTADYLFAVTVYVGFRKSHPDIATVLQMVKKLQENSIDFTQLVITDTNHCP